jgi:anti-anti-sigma factor
MKIIINRKNNISFVSIEGRLYIGNLSIFKTEWDRIIENKPDIIAISFKKLVYIDSMAIGSLIQLSKILTKKNIKLFLLDMRDEIEEVFKTTGLKTYFTITDSDRFKLLV